MESFQLNKTASGLHIEGFPDAVKFFRLEGPKARRLADLCLHRSDLEFAAGCLKAINEVPDGLVRTALWRSAVIHYMKCFGDSARFQLSAEAIYKGEPPESLLAFRFFKDLRNKNMVHDENAYMQSTPGAVLNPRTSQYKIAKILCVSIEAEVLGQENYSNLELLIKKALAWVIAQFNQLCDLLTKELETEPYDTLLQRESVTQRIPTVEDMAKKRG